MNNYFKSKLELRIKENSLIKRTNQEDPSREQDSFGKVLRGFLVNR